MSRGVASVVRGTMCIRLDLRRFTVSRISVVGKIGVGSRRR